MSASSSSTPRPDSPDAADDAYADEHAGDLAPTCWSEEFTIRVRSVTVTEHGCAAPGPLPPLSPDAAARVRLHQDFEKALWNIARGPHNQP